MQRRRALIGAQKSGGLPSEYQQVEYLQNTAVTTGGVHNYFDSGERATYQTELLMVVAWQEGTRNIIVCSPNNSGNVDTFGIINFSSTQTLGMAWFGQWVNGIASDTNFHTYLLSNEKMQIDGVDKQFTPVSSGDTGNRTIRLFAEARGSNASWNACKQKIKYVRIKQNGVLKSELIPCYHKTTQEIGFYDTVKKLFVTKTGTGSVTKGPDVT